MKDAAGNVLENLWPDSPVPKELYDLSVRLSGAPTGIDEQMEMAARGGANMALALVKSWYPDVQADMLVRGFHTGTSFESLRPAVQSATRKIAAVVDLSELVPAEPSTTTEGVAAAVDITP